MKTVEICTIKHRFNHKIKAPVVLLTRQFGHAVAIVQRGRNFQAFDVKTGISVTRRFQKPRQALRAANKAFQKTQTIFDTYKGTKKRNGEVYRQFVASHLNRDHR